MDTSPAKLKRFLGRELTRQFVLTARELPRSRKAAQGRMHGAYDFVRARVGPLPGPGPAA